MEFGVIMAPRPDCAELVTAAEDHGFQMAWLYDSPMVFSDVFACLALCAARTRTIRLGTGVTVPQLRLAPVMANGFATINQIAPGRVAVGIGTGNTARRIMGLDPVKLADLRETIRVTQALLRGETVEWHYEGKPRALRFLHQSQGFINVTDPVPVHVAAIGPKSLALTAELGDGFITFGMPGSGATRGMVEQMRPGLEARGLAESFPVTCMTACALVDSDDPLDSPELKQAMGPLLFAVMRYAREAQKINYPSQIPPAVRGVWGEFEAYVESLPEPRYLAMYEGYMSWLKPEQAPFITPDAIRRMALVGPPEELIERIRRLEAVGVTQIAIQTAGDLPGLMEQFSRAVIAKY